MFSRALAGADLGLRAAGKVGVLSGRVLGGRMTIEQSGSQEEPLQAIKHRLVPFSFLCFTHRKTAATHTMAGSLNSLTKFLVNRQGVNLYALFLSRFSRNIG